MTPPKITPTPRGFETRLRYGKGQDRRFLLRGAGSEAEALARASAMREMSAELVAAGQADYALTILSKAAEADTRTLKEIRKHCSALCAGKLKVAVKRGPGVDRKSTRLNSSHVKN